MVCWKIQELDRYTHGNYIGLATLFQIDQATLYADTQLTVYLLAEQN